MLWMTLVALACCAVPQGLDAAEPIRIADPKDKVIVEKFLGHVGRSASYLSPERCRQAVDQKVTDYTWVLLPMLEMTLTAYELSGDDAYLDQFAGSFATMRAAMTKGPDGYLGWYGKALDLFQDPDDPDKNLDIVINSFSAVHRLCRFLEIVARDAQLNERFSAQRAEYLDLIENHLVPKWDARANYVDLGEGGGVYRLNPGYNVDRSHLTMPHNMQSKVCRALLALYRVTGKDQYMNKAVKLGTRFKRCLKLRDGHYEWNYWDPAGHWDVKAGGRDEWKHWIGPEHRAGYYSLSLTMAVMLYHEGVVFDRTDMDRFLKTQLAVVWNGDLQDPRWARVDGSNPERYTQGEYVCAALAPFSDRVVAFLYTGPRQDDRVARADHSWQGGPGADAWLRGKYVYCPAAAGGRRIHPAAGERFRSKPENRRFIESLALEVTEPGYDPPMTPSAMRPMATDPAAR